MGRWSRPTAVKFLRWLAVQDGQKWLDVGCGTGALSTEIVNHVAPASVAGIDASSGFIDEARRRLPAGIDLRVGDAQSLPFVSDSFDVVVSGIALNFVPDAELAVREMRRVARTGGAVGVYLWDYNDGMEMIRVFWDVAVALNNHAAPLDEATRFPLCREDQLGQLFESFTWNELRSAPIETDNVFNDFDDFWEPFLGGQGPAPRYVSSLDEDHRTELRDALHAQLPHAADGSIRLQSRAWAVTGTL